MRSVRCDSCGTKALTAASKCPKCSYPIEVRDGFGQLLPLAHCPSCDSYYPESIGTCKWCGTTPQRAPITPHLWKGIGVAVFVAMAWGAWLVKDDEPKEVADARMRALLKPDTTAPDSLRGRKEFASAGNVGVDSSSASVPTPVVGGDSTAVALLPSNAPVDSSTVLSQQDSANVADSPAAREPEPEVEPVSEPVREVAPPPARATTRVPERPSTRVVESPPARSSPRAAARPPKAAPRTLASAKPTPKPAAKSPAASKSRVAPKARASTRWVSSVSRKWVIVRASASPQSRIIASIGPNTRVQLGETRGSWRRVKAKGLAGWVEHRSFAAAGASRSGRLAAR